MPAMRRLLLVLPTLLLGLSLAGCVATVPVPTTPGPTTSTPTTPVPKASASSTSTTPITSSAPVLAPTFLPDGTAMQNKVWFDTVNTKLFAANGSANGRAIIDSLVSSGFDKAAMQVTPDKTTINGGVDSILFSVKIGDSCLLGQHGGDGYSSAVEAVLKSGDCLIGKTRPIDW